MNKIIALLLILVMVVTQLGVSANVNAITFDNYKYELLNCLGIVDDTNLDSIASIADMINFISKLTGSSINVDETVELQDFLTYKKAVTMIVDMLGYQSIVKYKGNNWSAYLLVANDLGLTKGIYIKETQTLKLKEVLDLIYNSLDVPLMLQSAFGEKEQWESTDNKTILSEIFDVKAYKGIVTGTNLSKLNIKGTIQENYIEMDKKLYKLSYEKAEQYLGYNTTYYIKTNNLGEEELIYLYSKNNDELTISSKDINSVNNLTIFYEENDKEKSEKILPTYYVIYNGVALFNYSQADFDIKNGEIKFVDNNQDGVWDVVFVTSFYNEVIQGVNTSDKKIYAISGRMIDLHEKYYKIKKNGVDSNLEELKSTDVISVAKDKNSEVYIILASNSRIIGSIEEIEGDEVVINKMKIKISYNYIENIDTTKDYPQLKLNLSGIFKLDAFGEIACVEAPDNNGFVYAMLCELALKSGLANTFDLKIYTEKSGLIELTSGNYVNFNGNKTAATTVANELETILQSSKTDKSKAWMRLVKISFDNETIKSINLTISDKTNTDTTIPVLYENVATHYRVTEQKLYGSQEYPIADDTKLIIVNYEKTYTDDGGLVLGEIDDEGYQIGGYWSLIQDRTYIASMIDVDAIGSPKIMVVSIYPWHEKELLWAENWNIMVVDKVASVINNLGENCYKINGMLEGKEQKFEVNSDVSLFSVIYNNIAFLKYQKLDSILNIKKGDIIKFALDKKGKIERIDKLFSSDQIEKDEGFFVDIDQGSKDRKFIKGTIEKVDRGIIKVRIPLNDGSIKYAYYKLIGDIKYYKYNLSNKTALPSTRDMLVNNSSVIINMRSTWIRDILILE